MPASDRRHHTDRDFVVRSAAIRRAAALDPDTRCWRCGLTFDEAFERFGLTGAKWTAGHVEAGKRGGALVPEHARCNYSHGAKLLAARRSSGYDWP